MAAFLLSPHGIGFAYAIVAALLDDEHALLRQSSHDEEASALSSRDWLTVPAGRVGAVLAQLLNAEITTDGDDGKAKILACMCELVLSRLRKGPTEAIFDYADEIDDSLSDDDEDAGADEFDDRAAAQFFTRDLAASACKAARHFDEQEIVGQMLSLARVTAFFELALESMEAEDAPDHVALLTASEAKQGINAIIEASRSPLFVDHLLRLKHARHGMAETLLWAQTCADLPRVERRAASADLAIQSIPFDPFLRVPGHNGAVQAVATLQASPDDGAFQALLKDATGPTGNDATNRAGLLLYGALWHQLYVPCLSEGTEARRQRLRVVLGEYREKFTPLQRALLEGRAHFGLPRDQNPYVDMTTPKVDGLRLSWMTFAHAHLASHHLGAVGTWFRSLYLDPASLENSFFPGAGESCFADVLRGLGEAATRYQCDCGYQYLVMNCGGVREERRCPQCPRTLGGNNYHANAGQTRLDAAPVGPDAAEAQKDVRGYPAQLGTQLLRHGVRQLSLQTMRTLDALMHSTLLQAITLLGQGEAVRALMHCPSIEQAHDICAARVRLAWDNLGMLLGELSDEQVFAVMVEAIYRLRDVEVAQLAVLDQVETRMEWERAIEAALGPLWRQPATVPATVLENFRVEAEAHAQEQPLHPLRAVLEMREEVRNNDLTAAAGLLARRVVGPRSMDNFFTWLRATPNLADKHPFLALFEEERQNQLLQHLSLLPDLNNWCQYVCDRYAGLVSREEAEQQTVAEFFAAREPALLEEGSVLCLAMDALRQLLKLGGDIQSHSLSDDGEIRRVCKQLEAVQDIAMDRVSLQLMLPVENASVDHLWTFTLLLTNTHNVTLQRVLALQHQAPRQNYFAFQRAALKSMHTIRHQDLVDMTWHEEFLDLSTSRLEQGGGQQITYFGTLIEENVALNSVDGRSMLDMTTMPRFMYQRDSSQDLTNAFRNVQNRVAQRPLSTDLEQQMERDYELHQRHVDGLLTALGVLMFAVSRGRARGTIGDFLEERRKDAPELEVLQLARFQAIDLCYLQALYEAMEHLLADTLVADLADAYKQTLSDTLAQEEFSEDIDERLPGDLLLEHVHSLFLMLEKLLHQDKEALQAAAAAAHVPQGVAGSVRPPPQRKLKTGRPKRTQRAKRT
ncbi:uncharacterized protein MONBRDRAFT_12919 [Monosiga brevicollis MX1]|uniref:RZ-type domain-containing protein n=1 Tax=Monosiga brevicollis TaxID=81824 RepID=A9VDQ7_MONBE|nr:uncharacterized protein MONBRDRAFT_12919 [Monosiga brevicollis MX1]EDQ84344.1 predicted protein [Monosiga brevicollis MX1]|eukprot:XP_001750840.1 hypothetical protein [Monosiga brevicollis MX1]